MSSDDIILIVKRRNKFKGYWISAEFDYKIKDLLKLTPKFVVGTIEEAILKAQEEHTEYGYRFVNLELNKV